MCLPILLFLIIYVYIESLLFAYAATYIGGVGIFYEIILTVLLGSSIQSKLKQALVNHSPEQIKHVPLKYLGTVLLMFPGILSDVIGLLLQLPWFRQLFAYLFSQYSLSFLQNSRLQSSFFYTQQSQESTVAPSSEEQIYRFLNAQEQSNTASINAKKEEVASFENKTESEDKSTADHQSKTNAHSQTAYSTNQANPENQSKVPKIIKTSAHKID